MSLVSASPCVLGQRLAGGELQRVLIGLFSELDAAGGVQRAGRHIAAVMKEFADSRGMDCRFLSLNDSRELHRMHVGEREFVFTGSDRAKARFTATAVRAARRRAKLVVAGHVNLAPVVRAMHVAAPRMKSIICSHGVEVWEPLPLLRRRALRKATLILAPSQSTPSTWPTCKKLRRSAFACCLGRSIRNLKPSWRSLGRPCRPIFHTAR